jgi:hypothetical protein
MQLGKRVLVEVGVKHILSIEDRPKYEIDWLLDLGSLLVGQLKLIAN